MTCKVCNDEGLTQLTGVPIHDGGRRYYAAWVICGECETGKQLLLRLSNVAKFGLPDDPPPIAAGTIAAGIKSVRNVQQSKADALDAMLEKMMVEPGVLMSDVRRVWEEWRGERSRDVALRAHLYHPSGVPDERRIARFLLDTMTGGALSALICTVRDSIGVGRVEIGGPAVDSLKSDLRALGEEIP